LSKPVLGVNVYITGVTINKEVYGWVGVNNGWSINDTVLLRAKNKRSPI